jgi:hypothetical protein
MKYPLDLSPNPLLEKIKPTADDLRQYIVLAGYVGETENEMVRLYERLDLRTYLEIPVKDIIWAEKLVPGLEASPTFLVINAAAKGERVTSAARRVEAGYLSGLLASHYLRAAARGATVQHGREGDSAEDSACDQAPFCAFPHGVSTCHASGVCVSDPVTPYPA